MQGMFIFIFHVVRSDRVRIADYKVLKPRYLLYCACMQVWSRVIVKIRNLRNFIFQGCCGELSEHTLSHDHKPHNVDSTGIYSCASLGSHIFYTYIIILFATVGQNSMSTTKLPSADLYSGHSDVLTKQNMASRIRAIELQLPIK